MMMMIYVFSKLYVQFVITGNKAHSKVYLNAYILLPVDVSVIQHSLCYPWQHLIDKAAAATALVIAYISLKAANHLPSPSYE